MDVDEGGAGDDLVLMEAANARASEVEALVKKNKLSEALNKALEDPPVTAKRRDVKVSGNEPTG